MAQGSMIRNWGGGMLLTQEQKNITAFPHRAAVQITQVYLLILTEIRLLDL